MMDETKGSENDCHSTHLIDGNGEFNLVGLENFVKNVNLAACGLSYAVVSIMGPQSSGKSTLLNNLFGTNFSEMDALKGRSQTTKGIWLAKCPGIEPSTLVMDLEGTDGRERGEDDTAFEKQSALFALAVSDIVLINMWCHDIGREQAANKPLLKNVFQVMMRLFIPRKTTLLFVIRDKSRTPFENLKFTLREDIKKIWDSVPKPETHNNTMLSEFFNVEVVTLPSYEMLEEEFRTEVAVLRKRFFHSIAPGGLAGDRRMVVPASGFCYSSQKMWETIKQNKDLDLPTHKVMVATVRCEEIANEKISQFSLLPAWIEITESVEVRHVRGFGTTISSLLDSLLSEYDSETAYFDAKVRLEKRKHLEDKLLQTVQPAYISQVGHIQSSALDTFKTSFEEALKRGEVFSSAASSCYDRCMNAFDEDCKGAVVEQAKWDSSSKARKKLVGDMKTHIDITRASKLSELTVSYERKLKAALSDPVESLLTEADDNTWPAIRRLLQKETESAASGLSQLLDGFGLDKQTNDKTVENLMNFGRSTVEAKAGEEAARALLRMKDRFTMLFSRDSELMPRVWTGNEDIRTITKTARSASLKLLSVLSAVRLDGGADNIESSLALAFVDSGSSSRSTTTDLLASSSWKEVPSSNTLITPVQCKSLWRQFTMETEYVVTQAISAQEANKRNNNWLPPPWAIAALVVLGFNEFMTLLRNPLYLGLIFMVFLFAKALWVQLDISHEFRNGALPGVLSLSTRILPTVMNMMRRLAEEGQAAPNAGDVPRPSPPGPASSSGSSTSGITASAPEKTD